MANTHNSCTPIKLSLIIIAQFEMMHKHNKQPINCQMSASAAISDQPQRFVASAKVSIFELDTSRDSCAPKVESSNSRLELLQCN